MGHDDVSECLACTAVVQMNHQGQLNGSTCEITRAHELARVECIKCACMGMHVTLCVLCVFANA